MRSQNAQSDNDIFYNMQHLRQNVAEYYSLRHLGGGVFTVGERRAYVGESNKNRDKSGQADGGSPHGQEEKRIYRVALPL